MSDSAAAQISAPAAQQSEAVVPKESPSAAAAEEAKADDTAGTEASADTSADKPADTSATKETAESADAENAPGAVREQPEDKHQIEMKDARDAGSRPDADDAADGKSAEESTGPGTAKTEEVVQDASMDETDAAPSEAVKEPATPAETSKSRRKSASTGDNKKKLNRKGSRAKILHLDAKPGDYFFIRLKGYPLWPGIICDEDMLPQTLLKTRPVTAARPDGTYREDFADGGKRVADRTFPVMYLYTNEFGWIPNQDLVDLDKSTVGSLITGKMRKDLQAAHELAAEGHDLQYFKDLLIKHQEDLLNEEKEVQEQEAAKAEAKAAAAAKKVKKAAKENMEEDVEMLDADDDLETPAKEKKPSKKRKAEYDAVTPQRSDSVKKPKIKLTTNSTPKPANGTATPKSSKAVPEAKPSKSKPKKPAKDVVEKKSVEKEKEPVAPREPELSPEEKHARKEKEVLFLRHKLQKGLLTRDQEPKEDEMKAMSDFITKLEAFPDLEVSIIRATKINKVLKAILKLDNIPKEEEFKFKPRSQVLLDKWNKLLADGAASTTKSSGANGVNGTSDVKTSEKDASDKAATGTNGAKANGHAKSSESKAEADKMEEDTKADGGKEESGEKKEAETIEPEKTAA